MGKRVFLLGVFLFFYTALSAPANAMLCRFVLHIQSPEVAKLVKNDAYLQWLTWEQKANLEKYQKDAKPVMADLVAIHPAELKVIIDPSTPAALQKQLSNSNQTINWIKHPYNQEPKVPFINSPATGKIPLGQTASRSMAFLNPELRGFTVKMPTDYPHGPKGEYQPSKTKTNDDVDSAMIHSMHLRLIDSKLGRDPEFFMMPEVATIAEKRTGIGIVIRDVRHLDDGHYYLPAFSIPYVGRQIAKANGVEFEVMFKKYYAELLGRAKAKLLLRYGLQMVTPNPQNMLIQLDRDLRPTGKIIFRDISDSYLVEPVAKGLGFEEQIRLEIQAEYPPEKLINPFWSNSAWRLDEAGAHSLKQETLHDWGIAHNKAYIEYVTKELGIQNTFTKEYSNDSFPELTRFLNSKEGQEALKKYRSSWDQLSLAQAS